jgi:hypothetical protein
MSKNERDQKLQGNQTGQENRHSKSGPTAEATQKDLNKNNEGKPGEEKRKENKPAGSPGEKYTGAYPPKRKEENDEDADERDDEDYDRENDPDRKYKEPVADKRKATEHGYEPNKEQKKEVKADTHRGR